MEVRRTEGHYPGADGKTTIRYDAIVPDKPRAVVQFLHGMAEHAERYRPFGTFLAQNGIAFYIADHLGHGQSVTGEEELGYFGKDGWKYLVEDAASLSAIIRRRHPGLPLIVGGHSMGSFVCRAYLALHPALPDAALLIGTGKAPAAAPFGRVLAQLIAAVKGDHYRSKLLDKLSFGSYNRRIPQAQTAFDWLSAEPQNVQRYLADERCGFLFTADGFVNLTALLMFVSGKKWAARVREDLPILLLAGRDDPVGNYGAGVSAVAEDLYACGRKKVRTILYEGMRHEILNEAEHDRVYEDIRRFIEEVCL